MTVGLNAWLGRDYAYPPWRRIKEKTLLSVLAPDNFAALRKNPIAKAPELFQCCWTEGIDGRLIPIAKSIARRA